MDLDGFVASGGGKGQAFEFVSLRPSAAPASASLGARVPRGEFRLIPDGRLEARGQALADLARVAYGFEQVDPKGGVVDADRWMWTDRFDVTAAPASRGPRRQPVRKFRVSCGRC